MKVEPTAVLKNVFLAPIFRMDSMENQEDHPMIASKFKKQSLLIFLIFGLFSWSAVSFGSTQSSKKLSGKDYWYYQALGKLEDIEEVSDKKIQAALILKNKRQMVFFNMNEIESSESRTLGYLRVCEELTEEYSNTKSVKQRKKIGAILEGLAGKDHKSWGGWGKWFKRFGKNLYFSRQHQKLVFQISGNYYWYLYLLKDGSLANIQDELDYLTGDYQDIHGRLPFIVKKEDIDNLQEKTKGYILATESFAQKTRESNGPEKKVGIYNFKRLTGIFFQSHMEMEAWLKKNKPFLQFSEKEGRLVVEQKPNQ